MKYTINNYEEFALDYLEGTLSREDQAQYEAFLLLHPQIKESLEDFTIVTLPEYHPPMPDKTALYQRERPGKRLLIYWRAIAAAVLVLLAFGLFYNQRNAGQFREMAQVKPDIQEIPENPVQKIEIPVPTDQKDEIVKEESLASTGNSVPESTREILPARESVKKMNISPALLEAEKSEVKELAVDLSQYDQKQTNPGRIQPVAFIEKIEIRPNIQINYQIEHRPAYLIIEEEKREDPISKFGRLLARANLIPDGLQQEMEDIEFKEKVIPESYIDLK